MNSKKSRKKNMNKNKREETPHVHRAALAVGQAAITAAASHCGSVPYLGCKQVL
jgi:hypothetical protein